MAEEDPQGEQQKRKPGRLKGVKNGQGKGKGKRAGRLTSSGEYPIDPKLLKEQPKITRIAGNGTGSPACTATCKSTGQPCRAIACTRRGLTVCGVHGGKTPRGAASPQTKYGGYSKVLPRNLKEKFEVAKSDPELLSSREDISLLSARLMELAERLDSGESGNLWEDLRRQVYHLDSATDQPTRDACINSIKGVISRGAENEAVWGQIHETLEQKTKVSAHEWKRLVDMKQVITAERANLLVMTLVEIVMRHVADETTKKLIARDIQGVMTVGGVEYEN